jgi:polyisoprenoid-binding protein YceI
MFAPTSARVESAPFPTGAAIPPATTTRWVVDAVRSTLRVSVKVGVLTVHGTFADVTGHVELAEDPLASRVAVSVRTASLTSGSTCMDALLHGAGILDCARNPLIRFESTKLQQRPAGRWLLRGVLATDSAVLDVTLEMGEPVQRSGAYLFRASGVLPSEDATRLLARNGVQRILGKTMKLDLTVSAVPREAITTG